MTSQDHFHEHVISFKLASQETDSHVIDLHAAEIPVLSSKYGKSKFPWGIQSYILHDAVHYSIRLIINTRGFLEFKNKGQNW